MDIREIGRGGMDWLDLAQSRDRSWAPVNTVLNHKKKLRGFSPQANYTERATAACRRS
jgi:hypothetical protein